jgi:hypothetical protein
MTANDVEPEMKPIDPNRLQDPQYLKELAEEARAVANGMRDSSARETMLTVARTYEKLAASAEYRFKQ